jgi:hypothetical protein
MFTSLFAVYGISCQTIGNCANKATTVDKGFASVVQVLISLIGMLAVIFIIISGLQIILSAGNAKRFQQGRDGLLYSVVGVIVAILAYAVVTYVSGAL